MHHRLTSVRFGASVLIAALAASVIGACASTGASSSAGAGADARSLIQQTFTDHNVTSGTFGVTLTLTPQGSPLLSSPITLSIGGPVQGLGSGKVPQADLTATASFLGQNISFGLISTGTAGYVTYQGVAYQVPDAVFQRLAARFSAGGSSGSGDSGSGAGPAAFLGTLGIDPHSWLSDPSVAGTETIDTVETQHVHAGINVAAVLASINTVLSHLGSGSGLPADATGKIENAIQNPAFDLWTGSSDHILRKLQIGATVSTAGLQLPAPLNGITSVQVLLTVTAGAINQPQTITAPSNPQPIAALVPKLQQLLGELRAIPGLGNLLPGVGHVMGANGAGSSSGSGASTSSVARYSRCVKRAGSNSARAAKCAKLLH